jgi:hypothetical protein
MTRFSQREGHKPKRTLVQIEELDEETRTGIWNMLLRVNRLIGTQHTKSEWRRLVEEMWATSLGLAIDEEPADEAVWGAVKNVLMNEPWFEALDMVESYIQNVETQTRLEGDIRGLFNVIFERFLLGYRFIDGILVAVDESRDVAAIEQALGALDGMPGAKERLRRAAALLSDRTSPDYANSVKESISAVEAIIRNATHESTLGAGLTKLQRKGIAAHPALMAAWTKMYGWTSDASGVRHGSITESDIDQALAKYMLITCSAFISYLMQAVPPSDKGSF